MHSAPDLLTRWPVLDVATKRRRLRDSFRLSSGPLAAALDALAPPAGRAATGLWRRDSSVWSADPAVQRTIANRLGWLGSPALMADSLDRLHAFAASVKGDGFNDVVLLGMGGSSLAAEVLRAVLGVAPGWPRLQMLDSIDPAAIGAAATAPERTLYLVSSKSGTTIEPTVLAAHFRRTLEEAGVGRWADHFVAITDEAPRWRVGRRRKASAICLSIRPTSVGGIPRCRSSASCRRR